MIMNRKITSMLVAAMVLGGASAFAQNPATDAVQTENSDKCNKECRKDKSRKQCKGDRRDIRVETRVKRSGRRVSDPYASMELSADQRSRLDSLSASRHRRGGVRPELKCDSTLSREQRMAMADSARRASRLDYLRQVREIVGPEQYVIFLENIAVDGPSTMGRNMGMHRRHDGNKSDNRKHDGRKDRKRRHDKKDRVPRGEGYQPVSPTKVSMPVGR